MEKGSNSRSLILTKAYKLFLVNNLEKVTISNIEKITGKVRGTIFYHFKDKQNLFKSVVEEVFFPSFNIPVDIIEMAKSKNFNYFVDKYICPDERAIRDIRNNHEIKNAESAYFHFLSQASIYYSDFKNKMSDIVNEDLSICKQAIDNYKKENDIKNIDSTVMAFFIIALNTGTLYNKEYLKKDDTIKSNIMKKIHSTFIKVM